MILRCFPPAPSRCRLHELHILLLRLKGTRTRAADGCKASLGSPHPLRQHHPPLQLPWTRIPPINAGRGGQELWWVFLRLYSVFSPHTPTSTSSTALQKCRASSATTSMNAPSLWAPRKKEKTHPDSPRSAYSLQAVGSVLLKTCDLLFQKHLCFKNKVLSYWMWLFIIISWSAPFLSLKFYFIASSGSAKVGLTL